MDEPKKELAKLRREAQEIAAKIHDIVEDTLWSEYESLLPLSKELIERVKKFYAFKSENDL
ncbi:MAG: hypothetical protein LBN32_02635 [Helicobacteraceae bacterium]|nr:hypothetical protein [Helicobacteraceae bacterium]